MDNSAQKVLAEYESSIQLPAKRSFKQTLLCPVGLVGAGKTTVVKPLAEALNYVRISSDEIRKLLKEKAQSYEAVHDIAGTLVKKYLSEGFDVAIDSDCAGEESQKLIRECEKEFDVSVQWVHINPPESFIIDKLQKYKHTWLFKDANEALANYYARKPLHEHLEMPFVYTFDTSRSDLSTQLTEAEELLKRS